MISFSLFWQFVKYGLLCFGGGYMIIPLLFADIVRNEHFITSECFANLLSISQMTPGAVSINTATYVGYLKLGILGSFSSTIGLCFPTFILTSVVLQILYSNKKHPLIIGFFNGAKWASLIMIIFAIFLFANLSIFDKPIDIRHLFTSTVNIKWIEVIIATITVFLAKKMSFPLILFTAAIVGWGGSYL